MVAAFMLYATPVHADPAVAKISGGGSVGVGQTVSVTVSVNTEKGLWGVEGTLDYDPTVLKFVKGTGLFNISSTLQMNFFAAVSSSSVSSAAPVILPRCANLSRAPHII